MGSLLPFLNELFPNRDRTTCKIESTGAKRIDCPQLLHDILQQFARTMKVPERVSHNRPATLFSIEAERSDGADPFPLALASIEALDHVAAVSLCVFRPVFQ